MAVLHWNIRSFHTKIDDVHVLIQHHNPAVICLQESYHSHQNQVKLRGYNAYNVPAPPGAGRVSGGVSTLVKGNIPHRHIALNTALQATAVNVSLHRNFTVCNLYLPPCDRVSYQDLDDLILQLPTPFVLVGDFNAHSPLWGEVPKSDARGKVIETLLNQHNLCILNDRKIATHLHLPTGSSSSIDLSICSPTRVEQ